MAEVEPAYQDWEKDYICLGGMYPTGGIMGCLESPVDTSALPDALRREVGGHAMVSELKHLKGRASKWFLPGDLVVRYPGIAEEGADVFRRKSDVLMASEREAQRVDSAAYDRGSTLHVLDMDRVERLRSESLEQHRWSIEYADRQFTLCDPFGRVFSLVNRIGKRAYPYRWIVHTPFKSVSGCFDANRRYGDLASSRYMDNAWVAMKGAHAYMLEKGPCWAALNRAEKTVHEVFHALTMIGPHRRNSRVIIRRNPVHQNRLSVVPFWERIGRDPDAPACLKVLTRRITSKDRHFTRWLDVRPDELESVVNTMWWDEHNYAIWPVEYGRIRQTVRAGSTVEEKLWLERPDSFWIRYTDA